MLSKSEFPFQISFIFSTGLLLIRFPEKEEQSEALELKTNKKELEQNNNAEEDKGLTALQTISRPEFWQLWTIFMSVQLMQLFVNSYQKAFGQTFINDDKYFATVGTIANILNGLSRIFWGKLYDLKGFKFNVTLIGGVSTVATLTFLLMYLIPDNNVTGLKIFFGIWLVGFYTFFPGIYASMAPVTQATFGTINYSRDYGLLFTQSVSQNNTSKIHIFIISNHTFQNSIFFLFVWRFNHTLQNAFFVCLEVSKSKK